MRPVQGHRQQTGLVYLLPALFAHTTMSDIHIMSTCVDIWEQQKHQHRGFSAVLVLGCVEVAIARLILVHVAFLPLPMRQ